MVASPTPFQTLSSAIGFPDPHSSGVASLSGPSWPTAQIPSLPPHLGEEIEASKATHNAVNFWETLPFSTGLSRQTHTHTKHQGNVRVITTAKTE